MPDLIGMQALVQRIWTLSSRWHIGDVAWNATSLDGADGAWRSAVWTDRGETVAWGWAETDGGAHLDLVVDPTRPDVAGEVLNWFGDQARGDMHGPRDRGASPRSARNPRVHSGQ